MKRDIAEILLPVAAEELCEAVERALLIDCDTAAQLINDCLNMRVFNENQTHAEMLADIVRLVVGNLSANPAVTVQEICQVISVHAKGLKFHTVFSQNVNEK